MTKRWTMLESSFGCLAVVFLALAVLAVPTQQARADDCEDVLCPVGEVCQGGSCVPAPVCTPATVVCVTDPMSGGTACTAATNNVACQASDPLCHCRVRNVNGCQCGY